MVQAAFESAARSRQFNPPYKDILADHAAPHVHRVPEDRLPLEDPLQEEPTGLLFRMRHFLW
ncbi:MAG: hypothetical protein HY720_28410 [Planctomycetes bacterium]|nr:hypothetical protein [Planctomycetota bacterium]